MPDIVRNFIKYDKPRIPQKLTLRYGKSPWKVYHIGMLATDRKGNTHLNMLAILLMTLSSLGIVELSQTKHGDDNYSYKYRICVEK